MAPTPSATPNRTGVRIHRRCRTEKICERVFIRDQFLCLTSERVHRTSRRRLRRRHDSACLGSQLRGKADIRFGSPNVYNEAHTENRDESR